MESTRNCPLQFLMDLRNWVGDVDPRDTWKGSWTWCHPVCSFLTPWFKFPAVDESRVPPSSSSLPTCNFQSWQLPCLQSTGYTTGTFRYFCVRPAMLSFCSMQGNDPMGRACLLEELNAEIVLLIILFNISSALKKKKKSGRLLSRILRWPWGADGVIPGWAPAAVWVGLFCWPARAVEAAWTKMLLSTGGRTGSSGVMVLARRALAYLFFLNLLGTGCPQEPSKKVLLGCWGLQVILVMCCPTLRWETNSSRRAASCLMVLKYPICKPKSLIRES